MLSANAAWRFQVCTPVHTLSRTSARTHTRKYIGLKESWDSGNCLCSALCAFRALPSFPVFCFHCSYSFLSVSIESKEDLWHTVPCSVIVYTTTSTGDFCWKFSYSTVHTFCKSTNSARWSICNKYVPHQVIARKVTSADTLFRLTCYSSLLTSRKSTDDARQPI